MYTCNHTAPGPRPPCYYFIVVFLLLFYTTSSLQLVACCPTRRCPRPSRSADLKGLRPLPPTPKKKNVLSKSAFKSQPSKSTAALGLYSSNNCLSIHRSRFPCFQFHVSTFHVSCALFSFSMFHGFIVMFSNLKSRILNSESRIMHLNLYINFLFFTFSFFMCRRHVARAHAATPRHSPSSPAPCFHFHVSCFMVSCFMFSF